MMTSVEFQPKRWLAPIGLLTLALTLSGCGAVGSIAGGDDDDAPAAPTADGSTDEAAADGTNGDTSSGEGTATDTETAGDGTATSDGDESGGDPAATGTGSFLFDIDAVLAADADCASPASGDPLLIGYAADLSDVGGFADGPASQTAVHMADLINCSGGLDGRPVQVEVTEVSGNPLVSRQATTELVDRGSIALLGPPFPDPGFRVLQVSDARLPVFFTGSTEPALADDSSLSYLVAFSDTQGATAAAQFAQTKGWGTAVTFSTPGPYFGYNTEVFRSVFSRLGGTVNADFDFIPLEQLDFSDAVEEMSSNPPDVIYSAMLAEQWVELRRQLDDAGLDDVELLATDAFEASNGYALAGTDGLYHVTHTDPDGPRIQALLDSFAQANGGLPPASSSMAALAGDAVAVIAEAYLQTGSDDPAVLGQAISTVRNVQGVSGVLSYERSGAPSKPIYVQQVVGGEATLAAVLGG